MRGEGKSFMPTDRKTGTKLPAWLSKVIESGAPTDTLPIRRRETRRTWAGSCFVRPYGGAPGDRILVRGLNAGPEGLGCISRQRLDEGRQFEIAPLEGNGEPVLVRVVHCTQTVQGYKIGLVFEKG